MFYREAGQYKTSYAADMAVFPLREDRIGALQPLLKWCAAHRVGYRVVEDEDLRKLAATTHHEGVVADVLREEPQLLTTWLRALPDGPCCALWLDGVGNPHNLGAILRTAAHFGVGAVLLPKDAPLALSGAAARVAEGGAEAVLVVNAITRRQNAWQVLGLDLDCSQLDPVAGGNAFAQIVHAGQITDLRALGLDGVYEEQMIENGSRNALSSRKPRSPSGV